ncbi:alkyl sulfatase dimerization domain-containing protein [uncultured Ilumatobacter sp.]|uniref:alkyl sulfatase dimerization domain-containing protein n=1 Tax=uncultured Ilumatobacter sp. TaxID=879968 RepID=UPI00374E6616
MADLLALSSEIIDNGLTDRPFNRTSNELSEIGDGLAVVESFSHSVVVDSGDGLIAFDASHMMTGEKVVKAIKSWSAQPVSHLIYTHGHADHVGGSVAFGAEYGNMTVVGHRNVERRLERYVETNDWNVQINARQFGGVKGDFGMGDFPEFIPSNTARPDHIVDDRDTLRIGSRTVELHHARGETDDHLWAWMPEEKWMAVGDFVIWNFPNAGNPQKVQRFPIEWAAALREMIAKKPELLLPAHGLPIEGRVRIAGVLDDIATALELIVREVIDMMNAGEVLDTIVHSVTIPEDLLSKPYLRPLYDEPEFVVRGVWRQFGGWWDGAPSRLKPAPDAVLAAELAELAGGAGRLIERAQFVAEQGEFRLACHLADLAGWAAPVDRGIHRQRAIIYRARRKRETSLMAKGIFAGAARESEEVVGKES